ncbi:MAG TPA: TlpA family protein disulfide reductase [Deltaproteobacteria bacterium]|nr:TlpA family protein disulfide reductase [Deltaproteobacteria bacterium]
MRARIVAAWMIGASCVLGACRSEKAQEAASTRGRTSALQMAPDFTLPDLNGRQIRLSDFRGKLVIVDFWATWCPPCEFEIPVLNALYDSHKDRDVVILGVSVDTEGPEAVRSYAEKRQVRYQILMGNESLAREFGAPGFPSLIVVGPDGAIRSMHVGLVEEPELLKVLADANAGKAG